MGACTLPTQLAVLSAGMVLQRQESTTSSSRCTRGVSSRSQVRHHSQLRAFRAHPFVFPLSDAKLPFKFIDIMMSEDPLSLRHDLPHRNTLQTNTLDLPRITFRCVEQHGHVISVTRPTCCTTRIHPALWLTALVARHQGTLSTDLSHDALSQTRADFPHTSHRPDQRPIC
eukprot:1576789-Rhodomonas_salina.2